jgi:hypothetical protein
MKRFVILFAGLFGVAALAGEPGHQAKRAQAWTYDEAISQLKLYPKDAYLQYVVLQLGRRENRLAEASAELDRLLGNAARRQANERAEGVDLFNIFSGALAIQESLQLDTMRAGQSVRAGPEVKDGPINRGSGRPQVKGAAKRAEARPGDMVKITDLTGPTIKSHPWQQMLAGKKPEIAPLAKCVPDDFYYVQFRSLSKMLDALDLSDQWSDHLFSQAAQEARTQLVGDRLRKQLAVETDPVLRPFYDLVVDDAALTGSDLFVREGSDVNLLFRFKQPAVFKARMNGFLDKALKQPDAKRTEGKVLGVSYVHVTTPDRGVHVFSAYPQPDLHVRANSLAGMTRVLEAIARRAADGKAVRRLGDTDEFAYIRTLMPQGAAEEDGFVYLSDPFIRRVVGPQLKLTERRRMLCYNHLRMIGHAALLYRTEQGKAPTSLEQLARAGCAPGVFGQGEFKCPDGGSYALAADGMSGKCSHHGHPDCLTPCLEIPLSQVTSSEAEEYREFLKEYNQFWRTFFDPIAVRLQVTPKRLRVETIVLPLIDNSIYTGLAMALGGKPESLDALPVPKRNIFSVALRLRKDELFEQAGLTQEAAAEKTPIPGQGNLAQRTHCLNNLKQIGLALHNYHDVYGKFPAVANFDKQGKPLLSWRVHLLPYLEQDALYKQFHLDEPWDSENNKKLIPVMPPVFNCPASKTGLGMTTYLAPVSKEAIFTGDSRASRIADIADGTSNTVIVVDADDKQAVTWTKPEDLRYDLKQPWTGLIGHHGDACLTLFADGSVRALRQTIRPDMLNGLFTRAGGEVVNLRPEDEVAEPQGSRLLLDVLGPAGRKLPLLRYQEFLTKGIGNQVGLHVYDAVPLIDFNLPNFLGMTFGTFNGGRGRGPIDGDKGLIIGFIGASLTSPVYAAVPVRDRKIVDSFLEQIDPVVAELSRQQERAGLFSVVPEFYTITTQNGVRRSFGIRFGPVKWRIFWARIGDGLYLTNKLFVLDDLMQAAEQTSATTDKGPTAHAMLRLRPDHWDQVLPDYRLGWAENNREACLNNVGPLSSLARALGNAPPKELHEFARRVYGVQFYCPEHGIYETAPDGKSVSCSLHGTATAPKQPPAQTENSAPNKLLRDFKDLSVSLTFLEDGLHAVLQIERK